jgi:hypothetical protein
MTDTGMITMSMRELDRLKAPAAPNIASERVESTNFFIFSPFSDNECYRGAENI